jgi:hypothetical protein
MCILAKRRVEMVEEMDIFRSAESLLRNHGPKAAMECAQMVDRWTARGDKEAAEVWRRVMIAVRKMQAQRIN